MQVGEWDSSWGGVSLGLPLTGSSPPLPSCGQGLSNAEDEGEGRLGRDQHRGRCGRGAWGC